MVRKIRIIINYALLTLIIAFILVSLSANSSVNKNLQSVNGDKDRILQLETRVKYLETENQKLRDMLANK